MVVNPIRRFMTKKGKIRTSRMVKRSNAPSLSMPSLRLDVFQGQVPLWMKGAEQHDRTQEQQHNCLSFYEHFVHIFIPSNVWSL
jgi:hypothetical protein